MGSSCCREGLGGPQIPLWASPMFAWSEHTSSFNTKTKSVLQTYNRVILNIGEARRGVCGSPRHFAQFVQSPRWRYKPLGTCGTTIATMLLGHPILDHSPWPGLASHKCWYLGLQPLSTFVFPRSYKMNPACLKSIMCPLSLIKGTIQEHPRADACCLRRPRVVANVP